MKKRLMAIIMAMAMLLGSVAMLASCNETEDPTEENSSNETEAPADTGEGTNGTGESESGNESESGEESDTATPPVIIPDGGYSDGEEIKDGGISWDEEAFALLKNEIDESKAVEKTAAEMLALLCDKENVTDKSEGKVFKVTEPLVLTSNTKYYGNLSAVIAEGGIVIKDAEEIVIKELIIKGNITVENSKGITFFKLDLKSDEDGVVIDDKSSDISFKSCIINAEGTAIDTKADLVSVHQSYIVSDKGVVSSGDDLAIQNTHIKAETLGISTSGAYCTVKNNLIEGKKETVGVTFTKGSYNGLCALNVIKSAQASISVTEGYNCVVLLNSAIVIEGKNNTNLYVVENSLGGAIDLSDNNYLLCDANTFIVDGIAHPVTNSGNANFNGDNLHDVTARLEVGANEELLPHTNKELFVGMDRRSSVRDIANVKSYSFANYVRMMARQGNKVIVPPGAYSVSSALILDNTHSNTTLYAYGVYEEKNGIADNETKPSGTITETMGNIFRITGTNITVNGLTFGYDFQSSGQAYVLEKWTEGLNQFVRVIPSAGGYMGFANSDLDVFNTGIQICKGDMNYSWINGNFGYKYIGQEDDDSIVLQITNAKDVYDKIEPGDILGCRLEGENSQTLTLNGTNILIKDCVLYGYSAALAIVSSGADAKNVRLERLHNTSKPSPIIDKETYDRYKALEEKYGMKSDGDDPLADGAQGLEVYIDEQGRYRGSLPRWGSVDGTHITGAAQGTSATSTIFEHMVDDGSNQRASSSRIAGIHDNGDGTTTVYYKGSLAQVYFNRNTNLHGLTSAGPTNCPAFRAGDSIFAYNSDGVVLIEAPVLTAATRAGAIPEGTHVSHVDENGDCICDYSSCKAIMHYDQVNNGSGAIASDCKCDKCGVKVHTDYTSSTTYNGAGDGKCNYCQRNIVNNDGDGYDDYDKAYIIKDMAPAGQTVYNPGTSELSYKMVGTYNGKKYIITYKTSIMAVEVKTSDVNFDALQGFDLADNDYFMEEKIICDNVSLNSAGFTFDNVLMQNYHSRGILMKTRDSNVKNCTFRNVAITGMLLSIETTWGESSVPKNINIEKCIFDNTGHTHGQQANKTYSPIALRGLGDLANPGKVINENNLPCENINIIGNKFINTNNVFVMTIFDSKNVKIKDNIIECRTTVDANGNRVLDEKTGRAFYIERCINVEISGNKYVCGDDLIKTGAHIIAWDYKGLTGSDLYDADGNRYTNLPENKDDRPAS